MKTKSKMILIFFMGILLTGCSDSSNTINNRNGLTPKSSSIIDCNRPRDSYEREFCKRAEQQQAEEEAIDAGRSFPDRY